MTTANIAGVRFGKTSRMTSPNENDYIFSEEDALKHVKMQFSDKSSKKGKK